MRVLGLDKVAEFKIKHPTSRNSLDALVKILQASYPSSPIDLKSILGKRIDFVGKQAVIDAGGNKVRVISKITYGVKTLIITHVLTHKEYDKNKWKE